MTIKVLTGVKVGSLAALGLGVALVDLVHEVLEGQDVSNQVDGQGSVALGKGTPAQ